MIYLRWLNILEFDPFIDIIIILIIFINRLFNVVKIYNDSIVPPLVLERMKIFVTKLKISHGDFLFGVFNIINSIIILFLITVFGTFVCVWQPSPLSDHILWILIWVYILSIFETTWSRHGPMRYTLLHLLKVIL